MQDLEEVTAVKDAIHNPDDPRHFARIKKPGNDVVATYGDTNIARSRGALKLQEVSRDVLDPVYYFPRENVRMELLEKIDKTTHSTLIGDTEYFDLNIDGEKVNAAAWSYVEPYDRAEILRGYIAFDSSKVQVTEYTVGKTEYIVEQDQPGGIAH